MPAYVYVVCWTLFVLGIGMVVWRGAVKRTLSSRLSELTPLATEEQRRLISFMRIVGTSLELIIFTFPALVAGLVSIQFWPRPTEATIPNVITVFVGVFGLVVGVTCRWDMLSKATPDNKQPPRADGGS